MNSEQPLGESLEPPSRSTQPPGSTLDAHRTNSRFFDFMVRRVIALGFIIVGTLVSIGYFPMLLDPNGSILVNGTPEHRFSVRLLIFLLPVAVVVVGVFLFRMRSLIRRDNGET